MPNHTFLHHDDFIEMLERGDTIEQIARYAHVEPKSVERRFDRLPKEIRDRVRRKREQVWGMGVSA